MNTPRRRPEILRRARVARGVIRAVALATDGGCCSDVAPETDLEKTLYAIDELTGLVAAAALVRPSRSVLDLAVERRHEEVEGQGRLPQGADRKVIEKGAALMRYRSSELIADGSAGMINVAEAIGLKGNLLSQDKTFSTHSTRMSAAFFPPVRQTRSTRRKPHQGPARPGVDGDLPLLDTSSWSITTARGRFMPERADSPRSRSR